jgi:hypothetical protein
MLAAAPKLVLSDAERARLDEAPDTVFYATPRIMQHAEPQFIDALTSEPGPPALAVRLAAAAQQQMRSNGTSSFMQCLVIIIYKLHSSKQT